MGGRCINLVGEYFGRLKVLGRAPNSKFRNARWFCHCECGNFCTKRSSNLRSGHTKSCGCSHYNTVSLPPGMSAFNRLYLRYETSAKNKELPFELTKEDVSFITKMNCHYCGQEPGQIIKQRYRTGDYIYNGIDRIDSSKGYTLDNVVPCCKDCNYAKGDMSYTEFKNLVIRISRYRGSN